MESFCVSQLDYSRLTLADLAVKINEICYSSLTLPQPAGV